MMNLKRLPRKFFNCHPKKVAPKLLGKYLVVNYKNKKIIAKIVETEAYGGEEDLACHVKRFGFTKKTSGLFSKIGCAYIYPVHINTYCLNIVCHKKDKAGGILIRALEPIDGINIILKNLKIRKKNFDITKLLNGPGKLCKALNINTKLNGYDLISGKNIYLTYAPSAKKEKIISTPRINIPYAGIAKRWFYRFVIKDSKFLSKPYKL
ncbi:MAG: DNA-3-methyladenine glycosylase [Candidatus Omnitrophica bacterium]|nr:DNA-3-methyladenine glycosylase [Candidatus Omnitrophota bacterium]MCM8831712.1 DNA-3-methyladenine glycosylase [Candidatus Omnitrophota bacterium]